MTRPVDIEIFGHGGADLLFLADCLEGRLGEGRRLEAIEPAAKFLRAAVAAHARPLNLPVLVAPPLKQ